MTALFTTADEIELFIQEFESHRLPKWRWTHQAHLVVGLWYLTRHSFDDAMTILRQRIRSYNEAVGTMNTLHSGYHETLTRLFALGIAAEMQTHRDPSLPDAVSLLLASPLARKEWALRFYTPERLFSVEARLAWLAPDFTPDASSPLAA